MYCNHKKVDNYINKLVRLGLASTGSLLNEVNLACICITWQMENFSQQLYVPISKLVEEREGNSSKMVSPAKEGEHRRTEEITVK